MGGIVILTRIVTEFSMHVVPQDHPSPTRPIPDPGAIPTYDRGETLSACWCPADSHALVFTPCNDFSCRLDYSPLGI